MLAPFENIRLSISAPPKMYVNQLERNSEQISSVGHHYVALQCPQRLYFLTFVRVRERAADEPMAEQYSGAGRGCAEPLCSAGHT